MTIQFLKPLWLRLISIVDGFTFNIKYLIPMFEWHKNKEILNIEKHNITFSEASSVFDDYFAMYIEDSVHSINEERFVVVGYSNQNRLITAAFTERITTNGKVTRIISARKANKFERKTYEAKSKYH